MKSIYFFLVYYLILYLHNNEITSLAASYMLCARSLHKFAHITMTMILGVNFLFIIVFIEL